MRSSLRSVCLAVGLVCVLAACAAAPASPRPGPSATPTAASTQPAAPTSAAPPLAPAATPQVMSSPGAGADTAPPTVSLTADQTEVPWQGQITVHAAARDERGIESLTVLLGDQVLATAAAGELTFDLIPGALDGVEAGGAYTLVARATDAAGNSGQAILNVRFGPAVETPAPAARASGSPTAPAPKPSAAPATPASKPSVAPATPAPKPSAAPATPASVTTYRVTQITLPTYPYAQFLGQTTDPSVSDYPVTVLDRAAYEASAPRPAPQKHRLIVLENRYLRLGILPDLGGRIYQATFKPTGNNEFYSNPVVKPTSWGPGNPPYPQGANWWLGAGGLEWGFPVEEHGYEWGNKWGFDHVNQPDGGVMVTLFTRNGPQSPYAVVDVILPPDTAYFVVQPRITNPWGAPFRFKWWDAAMLAPGAANKPGPELRFIFPAAEVTVHSTGDPALPGPGQPMSCPVYNGRDLSRLGNWAEYLGVFQRPAAQKNYMGVYDPAADEGMMRIYPSDVARGAKLFAPGWSNPLDSGAWTDDGSGYVELHGGLAPTFDDWYELPPGGEVTWSEIWYPVAGIGGITYANEDGALALMPGNGRLKIGLFPTAAAAGTLTISLPGAEPVVAQVDLNPARPYVQEIALPDSVPAQGDASVTLIDGSGGVQFSFQGPAQLR